MPPTSPATAEQTAEAPLLTPDEFRALVARIHRNANRIERLERFVTIINRIAVVFSLAGWWISGSKSYLCVGIVVVCINLLTTRLTECYVRKDQKEVKHLFRFLENTRDVKHLGTILDLFDTTWHPCPIFFANNGALSTAVMRLIPLIQPGDADTLNTQQRIYLRYHLARPDCDHFSVLHALEKIGDKRDLPDVERLLKEPYITAEIRAAAERCAAVIRERVARTEGKDVLLRPERKPEVVDTLLRPSQERQDTPPEQLLRATSAADRDTPA